MGYSGWVGGTLSISLRALITEANPKVKSSVVVISGISDRPFGPVPGVAVRRCCRGSFLTLSSFADLLVFFGSCRCLGFPRDSPLSSDLWGFPRDSPGALFWILFP